ncbi:hypothetical protein B0O80DRAFT_531471 [Mortierella sp. GBAus27b]|nr:hypothetical protein BGX31_007739 [Mortierella sp. GBA43]KAI8350040.1 hypothetical protein B0O80DRAFT_531471 [Mortierella sp. GBAus27b]
MDLPEIRASVASYLSKSDLCVALRVCKSWQTSFVPVLYSDIDLSSTNNKKPGKDAVIRNAGFIQEIYLGPIRSNIEVAYLYADEGPLFPAVTKLYMGTGSHYPVFVHQVLIIRKCPQLKILEWDYSGRISKRVSDVFDVFKTSCPFVESLNIRGIMMTDGDVSQILDSCHRITNTSFVQCAFGEMAFRSLTRHFTSLQDVTLTYSGMTSKMTQAILSNCPSLVGIYGVILDVKDIIDGIEDHSGGWSCTDLEKLNVYICGLKGKPLEWHHKVFQQISRMQKLKEIGLNGAGLLTITLDESHKSEPCDGLAFRVEAGLDLLSSLKEMEKLTINGTGQLLEEQDVRWMAREWPSLAMVSGKMKDNSEAHQVLLEILNENRIQVDGQ